MAIPEPAAIYQHTTHTVNTRPGQKLVTITEVQK